MLKTSEELLRELGQSVRARRLGQNWSQKEAAERAGMGFRTWRRMEASGQATIENLVNAAIALRCEDRLLALFPVPAARSMDELLAQQRTSATTKAKPKRPRKAARAKQATPTKQTKPGDKS
jgi:transcriptional regulator with XRE-family HTH domain